MCEPVISYWHFSVWKTLLNITQSPLKAVAQCEL